MKNFIIKNNIIVEYTGHESVIKIPEGVRGIGIKVFEYRDDLRKVILPSTLEIIEREAFCDCDNLKEIDMSKIHSFKYLGEGCFWGTPYFKKYWNNKSNWENNVLYMKNFAIGVNSILPIKTEDEWANHGNNHRTIIKIKEGCEGVLACNIFAAKNKIDYVLPKSLKYGFVSQSEGLQFIFGEWDCHMYSHPENDIWEKFCVPYVYNPQDRDYYYDIMADTHFVAENYEIYYHASKQPLESINFGTQGFHVVADKNSEILKNRMQTYNAKKYYVYKVYVRKAKNEIRFSKDIMHHDAKSLSIALLEKVDGNETTFGEGTIETISDYISYRVSYLREMLEGFSKLPNGQSTEKDFENLWRKLFRNETSRIVYPNEGESDSKELSYIFTPNEVLSFELDSIVELK